MWTTTLSLVLVLLTPLVAGHGYILEPPGRSTMWRKGFNTPKNPDDNALFCGGAYVQNFVNDGKCGVCGDPWNGARENEAGGKYATGTIARTYRTGQTVKIQIIITANHIGWFEFKLCPNNNPQKAVTHACLDAHVLQLANGQGSKYHIGTAVGPYDVEVRLPAGLTCTQCVLQWRYHTGNSWGVDPDGRGCLGCGRQEEFYGCSDIAISGTGHPVVPNPPVRLTTILRPVVTQRPYQPNTQRFYHPVTSKPIRPVQTAPHGRCYGVGAWAGRRSLDQWCVVNCAAGYCPATCKCD